MSTCHCHDGDCRVAPAESDAGRSDRRAIRRFLFAAAGMVAGLAIGEGWLALACYAAAYLLAGWSVFAAVVRHFRHGRFFDENALMALSSLGALAIGEYAEGVAIVLFYLVGEHLQERSVVKARASLTRLMRLRPETARVRRGDVWMEAPAAQVAVGDEALVYPGERIPVDGTVVEGRSALDTAALTGESLPRDIEPGGEALSGCVNLSGVLKLRVLRPWEDSAASRILALMQESAERKTKLENLLTRVAAVYTPAVVAAALLTAILFPWLGGVDWAEGVRRGIVLLVISCPCALVLSIPLTFWAAIGRASRRGVLFKGSAYVDALNRVGLVAFDKTGTLTEGRFEVVHVELFGALEKSDALRMAASLETLSPHPIGRALVAAGEACGPLAEVRDGRVVTGEGVEGFIDGRTMRVGKIAWLRREGVEVPPCLAEVDGATSVGLAVETRLEALVSIADTLRLDAASTIEELRALGCRTVLLTGDRAGVAATVGRALGVTEVHADLLPGGKVALFERLQSELPPGKLAAFVGDGMNDAPVLTRADVGIAMGGLGSDAAMEAADVVLAAGQLGALPRAFYMARHARRLILENLVLIAGVKGVILVFGILGDATAWEAVFADVGVAVLASLNAMRGGKG